MENLERVESMRDEWCTDETSPDGKNLIIPLFNLYYHQLYSTRELSLESIAVLDQQNAIPTLFLLQESREGRLCADLRSAEAQS